MHYLHTKKSHGGFILLISALISSILLSIAIYMVTIAQKELILANLGRDSQYAFYAADAGSECALFWDFHAAFESATTYVNPFCSGTVVGRQEIISGVPTGNTLTGGRGYIDTNPGTYKTDKLCFNQNGRCVIVEITKYSTDTNGTSIDSRGYNVPCSFSNDAQGEPVCTPNFTPRTLERAVRLTY